MAHQYDTFTVTKKDDGVVLRLPDGSCVEVPQATIRRSAVLQEAIHASDTDADMPFSLPRGVLKDWLDALKAAGRTSPGHGTDIAQYRRLLQLSTVRCPNSCQCKWYFVSEHRCGWQHCLLVALQGQRKVTQQDVVLDVFRASTVAQR